MLSLSFNGRRVLYIQIAVGLLGENALQLRMITPLKYLNKFPCINKQHSYTDNDAALQEIRTIYFLI